MPLGLILSGLLIDRVGVNHGFLISGPFEFDEKSTLIDNGVLNKYCGLTKIVTNVIMSMNLIDRRK